MIGIIFLSLIVTILIIAFIDTVKNKNILPENHISLPPSPPIVTPTIVISGVEIGCNNYARVDDPEHTVSVVFVENDIVKYIDDEIALSLHVNDFLLHFQKRQVQQISTL